MVGAETAAKVTELLSLRDRLDAFEDDEDGPWFPDEGRPRQICEAPAHHPRRCHASVRNEVDALKAGRRCRRWAIHGRDYCEKHGGRYPLGLVRCKSRRMSSRYRKHLLPSLQERLDELLHGETHTEQLQLYEEIALARTFLDQTLVLTSAALGSEKVSPETRLLAMQTAQQAIANVAELCGRMAKIEKDLDDKVSVRQLGMFVTQLGQIIHRHLGDDPRVDDISRDLLEKTKLLDNDVDPHVEIKVEFDE